MATATPILSDAFPRLWRFPSLLSDVCKGTKVTFEDAAKALVDGYAEPVSAAEAFALLIERGEFDIAGGLLDQRDFLESLEDTTAESLRHKLNEERKVLRQRRLMRFNELRESACRSGVSGDYEGRIAKLENSEVTKYTEVEEQLAQLGAELDRIERVRGEELRRRFEVRCPIDQRQAWPAICFALERSLESKELDRAVWLLDQKTRSHSAAGAVFFEGPPPWPFSESPRTVCSWFLDRAAARQGFLERWGPPADDVAAWSLLSSLAQVLDQESELTAAWLGRFVVTLDSFLSRGLPAESRPVEARDGFFWTYLTETNSPWLPALTMRHGSRQPLVVPDPAVANPGLEALGSLVLVFDPWNMLPPPEGALRLTLPTLFRLMKDPSTRRQTLNREIGFQIPLQQALPSPLPSPQSRVVEVEDLDRLASRLLAEPQKGEDERLEFQQVSEFTRVFLETLGLRYQRAEDVDLIAFLANGHPALLQELLRALLSVISGSGGRHRRAVGRAIIDEAWRSEPFRQRARELLMGTLAHKPDLRLTLGVLYYQLVTGPIGSGSTVGELAQDVRAYSDRVAVADCLTALEELGLIELASGTGRDEERRFLLRRGGIGMLLADFLPNDLDVYLAEAGADRHQ